MIRRAFEDNKNITIPYGSVSIKPHIFVSSLILSFEQISTNFKAFHCSDFKLNLSFPAVKDNKEEKMQGIACINHKVETKKDYI